MGEKKFRSSEDLQPQGSLTFIKPSQLAAENKLGVVLEGTYQGSVRNDMTDKDDFKFETEDGGITIINNTGHLQFLINSMDVKTGDYCRVSYKGKKKYKGKESHEFLLEVAE